MQYSALGRDYEFISFCLLRPFEKHGCRTYLIGHYAYWSRTFGMDEYLGSGMFFLQIKNLFERELFVNMTRSVPKQHIASGL